MKRSVIVLQADTPTKNGRVYPREVVEKAMDDLRSSVRARMYVYAQRTEEREKFRYLSLEDVAAKVEGVALFEKDLIINVETFSGMPKGIAVETMLSEGADLVWEPVCYGKVAEDGTVSDLVIESFTVRRKEPWE